MLTIFIVNATLLFYSIKILSLTCTAKLFLIETYSSQNRGTIYHLTILHHFFTCELLRLIEVGVVHYILQ